MAEYKTFKCDFCGETDAIHFRIPDVDYYDPIEGKRVWQAGWVDACPKHATSLLEVVFTKVTSSQLERRAIWKECLRLKF